MNNQKQRVKSDYITPAERLHLFNNHNSSIHKLLNDIDQAERASRPMATQRSWDNHNLAFISPQGD